MGIRDILKKKNQLGEGDAAYSETLNKLAGPEFTFVRSDTNTREIIYPPTYPADRQHHYHHGQHLSAQDASSPPQNKSRRSLDIFRRSRTDSNASVSSNNANFNPTTTGSADQAQKKTHRLSQKLGLRREPQTSAYVPENLPQINVVPILEHTKNNPNAAIERADKEAVERQWEKRATILAETNEERTRSRSRSISDSRPNSAGSSGGTRGGKVDQRAIEADIQEAIRLHESEDFEGSTRIFEKLADPYGANDPLSQVLYGLALRHGWGCEPNPERAVIFLSAAASNAALVETKALKAGSTKGGAAKGELVLSIFELANCFRHGWGTKVDPVAAKQYYETAANLGDTDAMNEAAWCYLEGFGCKKDKFQAARYYRLAEKNGNKTLGNTWIWKDKYNPK
ncbi:HCP-like protein [Xylariaceae sp. FL0255]|nr:HCP-like protein [Xylariaceae sp. FL0255]